MQFCGSIMLAIPLTELITHASGLNYRNPDLPLANNYGSIATGAIGLITVTCGFVILRRELKKKY